MSGFTPNWGSNIAILNVKDYGAKGDGVTNDSAAIQVCIDAAFGPQASRNGMANASLNKAVFIPAGNYILNSPLYLTNMTGAWIFGNGRESTKLSFNGAAGQGNSITSDGLTPIFMMDGVQYLRMEGMTLKGASPTSGTTIGIYVFESGTRGTTTAHTYIDMLIDSFTIGIQAGSNALQSNGFNCDNGTCINVIFNNNYGQGLVTGHQNALNWSVYGGGGEGNATRLASSDAMYAAVNCGIGPIMAASMSVNGRDFYNHGYPMTVSDGSSESIQCAKLDPGAQIHFSGFDFRPSPLVPATDVFKFLDCQGIVKLDSCSFQPSGTTTATNAIIADLHGNGVLIADDLKIDMSGSSNTAVISGTSGSKVYLRGSDFFVYGNPVAAFGGTVVMNEQTFAAITKAGAFSTSDVPAGCWVLGRDTSNSTTKMYYNNAGVLQSVALT